MNKVGTSYREVELKAGGDWAPHQVYRMVPFNEIVCIENELVESCKGMNVLALLAPIGYYH